jgi:hypothetical protein
VAQFNLEELMYQVSGLFLFPVLVIIAALFLYAFFDLGIFATQYFQRRANRTRYDQAIASISNSGSDNGVVGYPLFSLFASKDNISRTDLEIFALRRLEKSRIVTRVAPMLGLVATMVPMGPALKALADGNIQGISENLVIAFSAVIFGLVTASITFWISAVSKRWMAAELNDVSPHLAPNERAS